MVRLLLAASALSMAGSAIALQSPGADAARAAGQIGERYDGYIGVAGSVSSAVRSQVAKINIQRRSLYSNLAAVKRVSPQDVGITAGCQLLAGVGVGQSYMLSDGQWRRRIAGQGSPEPDYCR